MESDHKSGVITFMFAKASKYTWITRKLWSNGARTILNDGKLCFTQFSTRIFWNRSLAASDFFLMFTQLISLHSVFTC